MPRTGRPPLTCKDAHPNDVLVGMRIKEAREEAGLTQTEVAKRIGILRQQVARHEEGTSRITRDRLMQIATITDKPFAFFAAPLDREDSEMLRLVHAVPAHLRARAKQVLIELGALA